MSDIDNILNPDAIAFKISKYFFNALDEQNAILSAAADGESPTVNDMLVNIDLTDTFTTNLPCLLRAISEYFVENNQLILSKLSESTDESH